MNWTPLPDTRDSLLARLEDPSDSEAWHEFVSTYEKAIWRYCRSRGLHGDEGLEVAQQVWLVLLQQVSQWRQTTPRRPFRAWLFETARRISLKAIRERTHWKSMEDEANLHARSTNQSVSDEEELEWQKWAFAWAASLVESEVRESTWRAFVMTALNDQDPVLVAQQLQMQVGAVYTAKCRVLAKLRNHIQQLSQS